MQVLVNCKTKRIDYAGNYRMAFQARIKSKKTFLADYRQENNGDIVITKADDGQVFPLAAANVEDISFFLNDERPYMEIVRSNGAAPLSFTIAPVEDNLDLGQRKVVDIREGLDILAERAHIRVGEYIDPNPLKLCPDGVRNMDELIALRAAEQAGRAMPSWDGETVAFVPIADEYDEMVDNYADISFDIDEDEDEIGIEQEIDPNAYNPASDGFEDENDWDGDYPLEVVEKDEPLDFDDIDDEFELHEMAGEGEGEPSDDVEDESGQDAVSELTGDIVLVGSEEIVLAEEDEDIENDEDKELGEVPDSEYVDGLLDDLGKLDTAASKIDQELCDYDDVIARSRAEQTDFLARINQMDVSSSEIVTGLIKMLQEQTDHNEALNATVKKEQILKRHCIEQLAAANDKVEQQSKTLDEVRRRLRFSQENQRKSEKFVTDARAEVKKVVDDANAKISAALTRVSEMQQQVKEANTRADAAETAREKALAAKVSAEKLRDEAMKFVDDEKARTAQIMDEFNHQLDSFTSKTLAKVKSQVERADAADQRYASATAKIASLESTLSEAKNKVFDLEMLSGRYDEDLAAKDEEIAGLGAQIEELRKEHALALSDKDTENEGAVAQLTEHFDQLLAEMEAKLSGKQAELEQAKLDFDQALAAKDENMAALVAARGDQFQSELSSQNASLSEQLIATKQEYESRLAEKDAEIARLASARQASEADYGDLMLEYNANKEELGNSGKMLSELESQLLEARGRIAELESSAYIDGYSQAQVDQMVSDALAAQSDDTEAAIQARDAVMIAGEKLMDDIGNILGMSAGFGGRKRVKEVEKALADYTTAYEAARAKSPTNVRAADFDMALEEMNAREDADEWNTESEIGLSEQNDIQDMEHVEEETPFDTDFQELDFDEFEYIQEDDDFNLDSIEVDIPVEDTDKD